MFRKRFLWRKSMLKRAIILISLSVDTEKETEFNDFYHHYYIPNLMQVIPEINTARRYQEYNVDGNLRYLNKRYLTIYECESKENAQKAMDAIQNRQSMKQETREWKKWQSNSLWNVAHTAIYSERYATREMSKQSFFQYIEVYHNQIHRHSAIGSMAP